MARTTLGVLSVTDPGPMEQQLTAAGIPVVTIELYIPAGGYSVVLDYRRVFDLARALLRGQGHQDFAVMCADRWHLPANGFAEGHEIAKEGSSAESVGLNPLFRLGRPCSEDGDRRV